VPESRFARYPTVFRPSRRYRRQFAGRPCPACGNRVDPADLMAFAPGTGHTFYLHLSCVDIATELAATEAASAQPVEEETPGAEATITEVTMSSEEA